MIDAVSLRHKPIICSCSDHGFRPRRDVRYISGTGFTTTMNVLALVRCGPLTYPGSYATLQVIAASSDCV